MVVQVREREGGNETVQVSRLVAHDDDPVVGIVVAERLEELFLCHV